ncbi:class I SAM-dependent methyltransferase [Thermodesulfobacteriota bacterium]
MDRVPERELMIDEAHVRAYAEADFAAPHDSYVQMFQDRFGRSETWGVALDLGCGPCDVVVRFARVYSTYCVHAVDGSDAMLRYARAKISQCDDVRQRITLVCARLSEVVLPRKQYDIVLSNSLLHHLADPHDLWKAIRRYAGQGAPVHIMDLVRPRSAEAAAELVEAYAGDEPEVLRNDFYQSLLAAYTAEEVVSQLEAAGLERLSVAMVGDRHMLVSGYAA